MAWALLSLLFPALSHAAGGSVDADDFQGPAVFVILSAFSFWRLWRNFRCARAIEDTPTAKVATAAQGEAELSGLALASENENIVCPLTGSPCLWYSFKVERHQRSGKSSHWVTVSSGRSPQPFVLEDETGRAWVYPDQAEVAPLHRRQWRGSSANPTPPFEGGGFFGIGSYRYTEEFILPGDTVYVLGWFETAQGGLSSAGDLPQKLRELKRDRPALLARFDRDKDGDVSGEEWDEARSAVEAELRDAALRAPPTPARHTITQPRESDLPFLISAVSQAELAGRYRRRAALCLAGFLGFGAAAVWFSAHLLKRV